jgi:hypothetical protein
MWFNWDVCDLTGVLWLAWRGCYGHVMEWYLHLSQQDLRAPTALLHQSPLCPCHWVWTGWLPCGLNVGPDWLHARLLVCQSRCCSLVIQVGPSESPRDGPGSPCRHSGLHRSWSNPSLFQVAGRSRAGALIDIQVYNCQWPLSTVCYYQVVSKSIFKN